MLVVECIVIATTKPREILVVLLRVECLVASHGNLRIVSFTFDNILHAVLVVVHSTAFRLLHGSLKQNFTEIDRLVGVLGLSDVVRCCLVLEPLVVI